MRGPVAIVAVALLGAAAVILPGPWGRTSPPGPLRPAGATARIERGAGLFRSLDCQRCHTAPRTGHGTNVPASLHGAGSRSREEWLADYLLDPHPLRYESEGKRPGLRMPALVEDPSDARALAALLSAWRDTLLVPEVEGAETWSSDAKLVADGRSLFDQYQCRGCHALERDGGTVGPALDGVGRRRKAAYVYALIRDPDRVIPETSMEDKGLWESEARAIVAYLMTLTGGAGSAESR